ncbi:hypothetical protein LJC33_05540 [Eubacteriales bacterium OttesenSCG-928-N13]|nr:hypothetical protein [Eubacteriales bacterium OttesenSCG-928-N13]
MNRNWKIGLIVYFTLCFTVLIPMQAMAYVDPSTTTFLIQAIVGVCVAVAAAVTVYWRRAKKKIATTLNIDENANKAVESDEIVFSKDSNNLNQGS